MRLPDAVRAGIEAWLEREADPRDAVARVEPVGGGCINPSARVTTAQGRALFVKWNASAPGEMFDAEAAGLAALAAPGALRVAAVLERGGGSGGGPSWLLLEHVETGAPGAGYAEKLGAGLAVLHREGARAAADANVRGAEEPRAWGWGHDNWIGSLPQPNGVAPSWADFWRDRRLAPQLELARERGHLVDDRELDDLLDAVPTLLDPVEEEGPSLLHGDLWGGNVMTGRAGEPVLVDPAVYRGHREVDLAMSELFGGFPRGFLDAYDEAWPLVDGYARGRRPLYQAYYLLVHVNLFGGSYVGGTLKAARTALSAA